MLLGRNQAEELLKRALRFSEADETQVLVSAYESYLTRFANNVIHQNVAEANVSLTIRAVVEKRSGTATTNRTDDEALAQAAERALSHARRQPEDPTSPACPIRSRSSRRLPSTKRWLRWRLKGGREASELCAIGQPSTSSPPPARFAPRPASLPSPTRTVSWPTMPARPPIFKSS